MAVLILDEITLLCLVEKYSQEQNDSGVYHFVTSGAI